MKKGFTLIELLAVIAILAIIMLIATPRIMDAIEEAKYSAYNNTKSNVEKAAELYLANHQDLLPENVGDETYISLDDLVNSLLIVENINDSRTGESYVDGDVIVEKLANGQYSYSFAPKNFVKENLLLAIDSADFKNNSQDTKLYDLSGNKNELTIKNFNYNSSSGLNSDGAINYDGVDDHISHPEIIIPVMTNWTVEFKASFESDAVDRWFDIFGKDGSETIMFHNNAGFSWYVDYESPNAYIVSSGLHIGAELNLNTPYTLSIKCEYIDATHVKVSFYKDGVLHYARDNYALNPSFPGFKVKYIGSPAGGRFAPWNLYYYRLYDRALTDDEILQNYNAG